MTDPILIFKTYLIVATTCVVIATLCLVGMVVIEGFSVTCGGI